MARHAIPPSYERVAKGLRDVELAEEIEQGRGSAEYQAALRAEQARRQRA